eukprot:6206498-Pleurochrysis_carterae.AAC.1
MALCLGAGQSGCSQSAPCASESTASAAPCCDTAALGWCCRRPVRHQMSFPAAQVRFDVCEATKQDLMLRQLKCYER